MGVREKTLNEKRLIDADRRTIATALKMIHDADFTPGVYEHSVYGKAALYWKRMPWKWSDAGSASTITSRLAL